MSRRRGAAARDPRVAAVRVMQGLLDGGGSLTRRLPPALAALAPRDRPRCQAFCYGLARWHLQLSPLAASLMKAPLKKKDQDLAWLIELGLYQLLHADVPAGLVVDETVEASATLGKGWARGLVNAVLRRVLRERQALLSALQPAARVAHPDWLFERLHTDWPEHVSTLIDANNRQAPMTLRVAPGTASAYQAELLEQSIESQRLNGAEDALQLVAAVPVERLPGFGQGRVSVQDVSAQHAVALLQAAVPAGGRLLDACAAPGGKTGHAAQTGHFAGIVALDVDAERLQRVRETLTRLDVADRVQLRHSDACDTKRWWDGQPFDAVLLDAPCSGTGVLRRHPDIKLLRRASDIAPLCAQQARLLDACWSVLAPGGTLLYATCSVLTDENEAQVEAFLSRTPDARADDLPDELGLARRVGRQRLPGTHDGDGFWYARLARARAA